MSAIRSYFALPPVFVSEVTCEYVFIPKSPLRQLSILIVSCSGLSVWLPPQRAENVLFPLLAENNNGLTRHFILEFEI